MKKKFFLAVLLTIALIPSLVTAKGQTVTTGDEEKPVISISEDIDEAVKREASKVKEDLEDKIETLSVRKSFAWNNETLVFIFSWITSIPKRIPDFIDEIASKSKMLGVFGTLMLIFFLAALLYSFIWQKRVISWIEKKSQRLTTFISQTGYPYFVALIDILTCALMPIFLLAFYELFCAIFEYRSPWFTYTGHLLWIWLATSVISRLFRQFLTNREVTEAAHAQGRTLYRWIHIIILYSAALFALYWLLATFEARKDVISLFHFFVTVSITFGLLLLSLKKRTIFEVLPKLDNPLYRHLLRFIRFFYIPLILASLAGALLWSFGYQDLGRGILEKIWFTAFGLIGISLVHHIIMSVLNRWLQKQAAPREQAATLLHTTKSILLAVALFASALVVLWILGLLAPLKAIMSFPLMQVGDSIIHFWTILKACLIILSFYFLANFVQSYLDYRVYPALGVDPGLGLVLNTSIRYLIIGVSLFVGLNMIGIDFKVLLVFAGAIGIGIGLGLQNLASNIISGFIIIFGRKIRKGDWIEEDGRLGQVQHISLRATKVKSRDNIEYLVPNTNLISRTIINYSYTSPLVRIHLPVGVSYKSNPAKVKEILLEVAAHNEMTSREHDPLVRFMEYADSSLNFELLVWIDVRTTPSEDAKSSLYFTLFEEFKKHGIEIPFPQRDVHMK